MSTINEPAYAYSDFLNEYTMNANTSSVNNLVVHSDLTLTYVQNNAVLISNPVKKVVSVKLNDGELLIGKANSAPVPTRLEGTQHQINFSNNPGTIKLSLPQDIDISSTPTFNNISLSSLLSDKIISVDNNGLLKSLSHSSSTGMLVNISGSTLSIDTPQDLRTSVIPIFSGLLPNNTSSDIGSTTNKFRRLYIGGNNSAIVAGDNIISSHPYNHTGLYIGGNGGDYLTELMFGEQGPTRTNVKWSWILRPSTHSENPDGFELVRGWGLGISTREQILYLNKTGQCSFWKTDDASSTTSAPVMFRGGVAIAKTLYANAINVPTSITTNNLIANNTITTPVASITTLNSGDIFTKNLSVENNFTAANGSIISLSCNNINTNNLIANNDISSPSGTISLLNCANISTKVLNASDNIDSSSINTLTLQANHGNITNLICTDISAYNLNISGLTTINDVDIQSANINSLTTQNIISPSATINTLTNTYLTNFYIKTDFLKPLTVDASGIQCNEINVLGALSADNIHVNAGYFVNLQASSQINTNKINVTNEIYASKLFVNDFAHIDELDVSELNVQNQIATPSIQTQQLNVTDTANIEKIVFNNSITSSLGSISCYSINATNMRVSRLRFDNDGYPTLASMDHYEVTEFDINWLTTGGTITTSNLRCHFHAIKIGQIIHLRFEGSNSFSVATNYPILVCYNILPQRFRPQNFDVYCSIPGVFNGSRRTLYCRVTTAGTIYIDSMEGQGGFVGSDNRYRAFTITYFATIPVLI